MSTLSCRNNGSYGNCWVLWCNRNRNSYSTTSRGSHYWFRWVQLYFCMSSHHSVPFNQVPSSWSCITNVWTFLLPLFQNEFVVSSGKLWEYYGLFETEGVIFWSSFRLSNAFMFFQVQCSSDFCRDVRTKAFQATEQFVQSVKDYYSKVRHCYSGCQLFSTLDSYFYAVKHLRHDYFIVFSLRYHYKCLTFLQFLVLVSGIQTLA